MPLLNILVFPDPGLKKIAIPVLQINDEIKQLASDMLETMYNQAGVGLAATQVNIHKRIIVLDVSEHSDSPLILINPVIVQQDGDVTKEEGCLSFPGIYAKINRFVTVAVEYQDLDGVKHSIIADELFSNCLQHEIDHLNGITIYNRISPLKRTLLKKKLKNLGKK